MPDNINNKTLTERQQLDLIAKMVDTIWTDKMTLPAVRVLIWAGTNGRESSTINNN